MIARAESKGGVRDGGERANALFNEEKKKESIGVSFPPSEFFY